MAERLASVGSSLHLASREWTARSFAPLECDVLQLTSALDLQRNRLSWAHMLKQRPELWNGFDTVTIDLINDVAGAQVGCVDVEGGRLRDHQDSRGIRGSGERAAESAVQGDHEYTETIDCVPRIDEIG